MIDESNHCNLPAYCITIEEHATFVALGDSTPFYDEIWKTKSVREALLDKGDLRKKDMDDGHVSFQVLSQLPGIGNENPEGCTRANDELAAIIANEPNRYGGFAALSMAYPAKAAKELERAVVNLGLIGAMIDNHLPDMTHYNEEKFWPVFEVAERLDVPIYFHPSPASAVVMAAKFEGNWPKAAATGLSTGAWGWHENVGLHIVKLFAAGVFTKFPKLKVIIGHMGEMIPMMIDRIERLKFFKRAGLGSFREIWENNIWVTTSGIFSVRTLEMLLKVTTLERVIYSVDSPFEQSITGWNFIKEVANSSIFSSSEMEKFAYGNAQKLLKLKTT